MSGSLNPGGQVRRFGLLPVRSPLLGESLLSSLPPGTEMFHFPGLAAKPYLIRTPLAGHCPRRVFPFGHLRIKACLPLPGAFRSLPRPSSPAGAKASVTCPSELGQKILTRPKAFMSILILGEECFSTLLFSMFRIVCKCQRA